MVHFMKKDQPKNGSLTRQMNLACQQKMETEENESTEDEYKYKRTTLTTDEEDLPGFSNLIFKQLENIPPILGNIGAILAKTRIPDSI